MRFIEFKPIAPSITLGASHKKKTKSDNQPTSFEKNVRRKKARKGDLKPQKPVKPIKGRKL